MGAVTETLAARSILLKGRQLVPIRSGMRNGPAFHVPIRPYTPIDALNARAAALGSPRYASAASLADYNGHRVTVAFNDHRRYYTSEYFWAGRIVLSRGDFAPCLRSALDEQARGAKGASVAVCLRADDAAALALCEAEPMLVPGELPSKMPDWYTWQHECAAAAARDSANPRAGAMIFDWSLMQAAADRGAYEMALQAKYGRVWES